MADLLEKDTREFIARRVKEMYYSEIGVAVRVGIENDYNTNSLVVNIEIPVFCRLTKTFIPFEIIEGCDITDTIAFIFQHSMSVFGGEEELQEELFNKIVTMQSRTLFPLEEETTEDDDEEAGWTINKGEIANAST